MPAYAAPASHRASFPEEHPLFAGILPAAPAALAQALAGFDALLVAGAPVFTFRVEGHCALFDPGGPAIWQLTADPAAAVNAGTGTAILGDVRRALEGLAAVLPQATGPCRPAGRGPAPEPPAGGTLTAEQALRHVAQSMPADAIIAGRRRVIATSSSATSRSAGRAASSPWPAAGWAMSCRPRWPWPWPRRVAASWR